MTGFSYITDVIERVVAETATVEVRGRVTEVLGTIIKAVVPGAGIGELCLLRFPQGGGDGLAEVVGFNGREALLAPMGEMMGVSAATEVVPTGRPHGVQVSEKLLGRVLDGMGKPMDGKGAIQGGRSLGVYREAPLPMTRRMIEKPLPLGVRALDGLLTCGEGQRLGVFAAAGVGKSTLLSSIVRGTAAEVTVLALIGERGREVREFIERDLGAEGMARSVVVVATSDKSAMERAKAAFVATTVAEYFRNAGRRVLFLMDSVTRFARAQREIGLAAGEPPTRRGFPPSVFAILPRLMERAGMAERGSITALYTVLVEGDDMTEPVADETRSILDGHIVLSRSLAERNHYPAIDILASVSRVMNAIVADTHKEMAGKVRSWLSLYKEVEMMIRVGEYKRGADPRTDEAVERMERVDAFLRQGQSARSSFDETLSALGKLTS